MSDEFVAAVAGNAIAGLGVWALTAALLWAAGIVRARRARRRAIIALVNRAHAVAFSAVGEGLFAEALRSKSREPLREAKTRYDELTAEALNLFTPRETDVAFWCAVELYAGWRSPLEDRDPEKYPDSLSRDWVLPRAEVLAGWADVYWPWDIGSARGPQYATRAFPDGFTAGDRSRHGIVPPNTDVNADMLWAYANYIRRWKSIASGRRARELQRMFPDGRWVRRPGR